MVDAVELRLARLDAADGVPRFDRASERLHRLTGWTLVAVPGLIPAGSAAGLFSTAACLADGVAAARRALAESR
jgi:hypothetical protein